ncbi:MAG: histidinol-phosphatase [Proteobacteria bacterium]|nr:histidinol-phosphatase [Pseudomonadota bacterium]
MTEARAGDDRFIALAEQLAEAARNVVMPHFRTPLAIDAKADQSPVTIADKDAEVAMRGLIEATFPDHGIIGEEFPNVRTDAEFVWVLDPIDGTQSFVTGKPLFGTLIALLQNGRPILGVLDMPALNERWIGVHGQPTTFNGKPVTTRACESVEAAWLYATSPHMFKDAETSAYERLQKASWRAVYGAECMAYGLLANGYVDIVCEGTMDLHDYAPMVPIIEGAGGVITNWKGKPLAADMGAGDDGTVLAAGDKRIHAAALELLAG